MVGDLFIVWWVKEGFRNFRVSLFFGFVICGLGKFWVSVWGKLVFWG